MEPTRYMEQKVALDHPDKIEQAKAFIDAAVCDTSREWEVVIRGTERKGEQR